MRYFDKTFFKFLFGFGLIIVIGLVFISKVQAQSALVNINTASSQELQTLNGIGPTYAQRIIDYRTANGPFSQIEDIKNVSGIGDAIFNKVKDYITIGQTNNNSNQTPTSVNLVGGSTGGGIIDDNLSSSSAEVDYVKATAFGDRVGVIGQPMEFRAEANSKKIHLSWNFGDGSVAYGQVVTHSYDYPGEYVVMLSGSMSGKKSISRLNVKISPDTLSITQASADRIEISNLGKNEINLYGRELVFRQDKFIFPEDTIILPNQKISFSSKITKLYPTDISGVRLSLANSDYSKPITSPEDQRKIEEITNQIISLQIKQMELKNDQPKVEVDQFATAVFSDDDLSVDIGATSTDETLKSAGFFRKIKRFFGFK